MKTELGRKLRMNSTGFIYQVDGQQITAVGGQYNTATLLNADKTDGYGFEADLDYAPSADWLFTLGASYNHTEINDPNLAVAPAAAAAPSSTRSPTASCTSTATRCPTPRSGSSTASSTTATRSGQGVFKASLDWAYHSEKSFFLYQSKEFRADSLEVGARVGYGSSKGKFEVAAFGRNLLDEVIVAERHRLRQPHRHDQRAAHDRPSSSSRSSEGSGGGGGARSQRIAYRSPHEPGAGPSLPAAVAAQAVRVIPPARRTRRLPAAAP